MTDSSDGGDNRESVCRHAERDLDRAAVAYLKELEDIIERETLDGIHRQKRIYSFLVLDRLLDCCQKGVCPPLREDEHRFLIDISLQGYIQQRAYYYSVDGIGVDDDDRYNMAKRRIEQVLLRCEVDPNFKDTLFKRDYDLVREGETTHAATRRKAYWQFMHREYLGEDGDAYFDWNAAEVFFQKMYEDKMEEDGGREITLDECRRLWLEHLDKANGVDLYRFCCTRKPPRYAISFWSINPASLRR